MAVKLCLNFRYQSHHFRVPHHIEKMKIKAIWKNKIPIIKKVDFQFSMMLVILIHSFLKTVRNSRMAMSYFAPWSMCFGVIICNQNMVIKQICYMVTNIINMKS